MEPSTWPSTNSGLSARPTSWAIHTSVGVTSPVSRSTLTSTTQAEEESQCGAPTPPHRPREVAPAPRIVGHEPAALRRGEPVRRGLELPGHRLEEARAQP